MKTFLHTQLTPESGSVFTKLYAWRSAERYWVPRDRTWFTAYTIFFLLIILIGVLLKEFIFILAVLAFAFLWFVNALIPPEITEHNITTIGVRAYNKLFRWKNIKHFWFSEKNDVVILHLDIKENEKKTLTTRVNLLLNEPGQDKEIFDVLIRFIDFGEKDDISYSYLTKFTDGEYYQIERYLPDDEIEIMQKKKLKEVEKPEKTNLLSKIPKLHKSPK